MRILILIATACVISACASGYSQFYTPVQGATPEAIAELRASPPPAEPLVDRSPSVPDVERYAEYGFVPIGYSSFNSGQVESENSAVEQAKKVSADLVVIVNPSYTGSVTSQVPITTPTTSTSYTTASATAYGPGGPVSAQGNATTTTYGSKTTYIPMTVNRYDYGAVYFIKRNYIFGANWRDLDTSERAKLQSNSGVFITTIVKNTPAFNSDVLVGDIIRSINGVTAKDGDFLSTEMERNRGKEIVLVIYRNGQEIEKRVMLSN